MEYLPEGYHEMKQIDLQKDKKLLLYVSIISMAIMVIMIIIALFFRPIWKENSNLYVLLVKLLIMTISMIAYVFIHELIHGFFIKKYSGIKPYYGFTGLFAYTGSKAYFDKKQYIIIALSPIIIMGVILLVLNIILPIGWFWVVYLIQVINISGATGDLMVSYIINKLPSDSLIKDNGISMIVYSKH